ncbi:hypothetical protein ACFQ36_08230 [Arthrobacter sp. GCM10027362]
MHSVTSRLLSAELVGVATLYLEEPRFAVDIAQTRGMDGSGFISGGITVVAKTDFRVLGNEVKGSCR